MPALDLKALERTKWAYVDKLKTHAKVIVSILEGMQDDSEDSLGLQTTANNVATMAAHVRMLDNILAGNLPA